MPILVVGLDLFFATLTRLELATSAVTGRHSNQLSYRAKDNAPFAHPTEATYPCCVPTLGDSIACRHTKGALYS